MQQLSKEIEVQSQLDCIMHITEAINMNESVDNLLLMYLAYLSENMQLKSPEMIIQMDDLWYKIQYKANQTNKIKKTKVNLDHILKTWRSLNGNHYIIEVKHKDTPIAYTLINDPKGTTNRFTFLHSITNIIAVAIENKRLFKKQLEQERYKKEIELASEVQKMLIPGRIPRSEHIEIATIYRPQLNVGGDYYDFIEKKNGQYIFCVADISGKGVGAALLMANFQSLLKYAVRQMEKLSDIVVFLNDELLKITNSERIITLFLCQYNVADKELLYINAGHIPPFLITNDTIQILKEGTTVLGAFETLPKIKVGKTILKKETLIMAYTDGLTDLQNDAGVYFDDYCLKYFLLDNLQKEVDVITMSLVDEMDKFKGRQDYPDDIAILVCKIKP